MALAGTLPPPRLQSVLVSGKPHLGTDRLVSIIRAFRAHLLALGVDVRFEARVAALLTGLGGRAAGVRLAGLCWLGGG